MDVIYKENRALSESLQPAERVPVSKSTDRRTGAMKGKFVVPEGFDAPLPDDLLDALEGSQR